MAEHEEPNARYSTATVKQLQQTVDAFCEARNWARFHTPKNLAMSIAIEAAEIMELFQWSASDEVVGPVANDSPVAEEMADVLAYLLRLASVLEVDLEAALVAKMTKNAIKYPADKHYEFPSRAGSVRSD